MNVKMVLAGLMIVISPAKCLFGDYHYSSSAAFDEGKLSSISRFFKIGMIYLFLSFLKVLILLKTYYFYLLIILFHILLSRNTRMQICNNI